MNKEVIIIGSSGHGNVIADIILKSGDKLLGFLDDDLERENPYDVALLGKVADCLKYIDKNFIIAIGNNEIRKKIAENYPNLKYYTAIHPSAIISSNVKIGKGSCVMAGSVVNACVKIGEHCIINSCSVVEHDCEIGNYSHLSPNACLCGTVKVGNFCHIGAGVTVKNNLFITDNVVVGIGAAIVKNIEEAGTYVGVPAKKY